MSLLRELLMDFVHRSSLRKYKALLRVKLRRAGISFAKATENGGGAYRSRTGDLLTASQKNPLFWGFRYFPEKHAHV
jgi:hypothetical protein